MFIIPESLFTMPGIRVHVRLESVFTITRNTHFRPTTREVVVAARRQDGGIQRTGPLKPTNAASSASFR